MKWHELQEITNTNHMLIWLETKRLPISFDDYIVFEGLFSYFQQFKECFGMALRVVLHTKSPVST